MTAPRNAVIVSLVDAALGAMVPIAGTASGDEVLSAMVTIGYRAIELAARRGTDLTATREAVERMWALLPPEVPRA